MPDVVLEPPHDPIQGMPTGAPTPAPPAAPPAAPPQTPPAAATPPTDPNAPLVPADGVELDEDGYPIAAVEGDDEDPNAPPARRTIVGDLVRERARRQAAESQAESATALVRTLMQSPEGMAALQRAALGDQAPPAAPSSAEAQAAADAERVELEALAIDLGLYDAESQPDLKAAKRVYDRQSRMVDQAVQRATKQFETQLQPLKMTQADQIIGHVMRVAESYGIDPQLVENGLRSLPVDQIGNPQVQQTVLMTALGLQTFGALDPNAPPQARGRRPAPVPPNGPPADPRQVPTSRATLRPPIFQEPPGGRPRSAPVLDDAFRARLRESGLKDTEIDESVGRFVPGAPNRLE